MSFAAPDKPVWEAPAPPRKGSGLKWILLGCGGFMLVGVLLCGGAAVWGVRWGMAQVNKMTEEFVAKGYEKEMGQVIQVNQSPETKTVYACQMLTITKDVDVDIAAVCQMMEVKANIHGDLDFLGQILKVHAGSVIDGDLRVKNGQVIEIYGEVKGKISGNYMVLKYRGKDYGPGQSPTPDEGPDAPVVPVIPESPPFPVPAPAANAPAIPDPPATPAAPATPEAPAPAAAPEPPKS